ncbi:hypothetical protein RFI_04716 [Reticulomyxa filosa]|uniref:SecA family profile domain-containing protein n=1 Tax=Reticulomyxa filosa TaxID=46433 RepID=X6P2R0_RETFI|nr:hypothetical protein RFI_04716 [Reticulomyxa filosa]|eukprot:ETO32398.1 hypothetical protein RFI_04716 [Reticulomyxa filosa]
MGNRGTKGVPQSKEGTLAVKCNRGSTMPLEKEENKGFKSLPTLPLAMYQSQSVLVFDSEIALCGRRMNSECYSYHTQRQEYKRIGSYPKEVQLLGHCVIACDTKETKEPYALLLSFGGRLSHTLLMKYKSVWTSNNNNNDNDNDNDNDDNDENEKWNEWIDLKWIGDDKREEENWSKCRGALGGRNKDLLFVAHYPSTIDVIRVNTHERTLQYVCNFHLPTMANHWCECFLALHVSNEIESQRENSTNSNHSNHTMNSKASFFISTKKIKIGYKEQDGISYNIRYGYKTLFAYYHENAQNKISAESLKNNIFLSFQIGSFSYAMVPERFYCIMGVSGTLETLSAIEQGVVEKEYHISKHTYMPSLFGKNQLAFAEKADIFIVNESDYFITLKKEIDDRLVGKTQGTKRAVLVFFETKKQLMEFYGSPNFAEIKDDTIVMTEENSFAEKESLIKRATSSGQVGLFTKVFGRGTDFVCRDQIVSSNGGPHVIQTFLSEELSEEVQIKGRTARQGGSGSYSLVLCDKSLEKFSSKIEIENARNAGNFYPMLNAKRGEFFKTQYTENKKYVKYAAKEHETSEKLIASVKKGLASTAKKLLCERNKGVEERKSSRTVVLMDATGSMEHLLQKAKNTVCTMFDRISTILKDKELPPDCFEMQFVVYRNYNAPEDMILQASPWESKPDNLRKFMETICAGYGLGNEAIEIGLAYVNTQVKEMEISQVILIGDMPPNKRQEVQKRRQIKGENYWKGTKFPIPTYYKKELGSLKKNNITVHAFYVNEQAKGHFEAIARTSGGKCVELQINSDEGSEQLTGVVSTTILKHAGGSRGDELVEAYRAKFAPKLHI